MPEWPRSMLRRKHAFQLLRLSAYVIESALNIFFIQENTLEFLHQQLSFIATTIQPLEPSYTHKMRINR